MSWEDGGKRAERCQPDGLGFLLPIDKYEPILSGNGKMELDRTMEGNDPQPGLQVI
ncbi:MAG: hypothetical protein V4689_11875 [Verrucomicrobiota bacterium]